MPIPSAASRRKVHVEGATIRILVLPLRDFILRGMPTRPTKNAQSILADARHVLLGAQEHAKKLKAADKGKAKLFPGGFDAFLKGLAADVKTAEKALGAVATRTTTAQGATLGEKQRRAVLYQALTSLRADVSLRAGGDAALARAFGVGRKLTAGSTPELLDAAGAVLAAFEEPAIRKASARAGVTPARIKACAALRDALAAADAAQGTQTSARKAAASGKKDVLDAVTKSVALVRKVVKVVLRDDDGALASFASAAPRHTVKKRAKTGAPAPATGA
jgi:hypothetical protein